MVPPRDGLLRSTPRRGIQEITKALAVNDEGLVMSGSRPRSGRHPTTVNQGAIVERNPAAHRISAKFAADEGRHLLMGRGADGGGIGGGVEPPQHAVQIEQLAVLEAIEPILPLEEGTKIVLAEVAMIDLLVIPRVGVQPGEEQVDDGLAVQRIETRLRQLEIT